MKVYSYLSSVKEKSPLVHHLTNWVTIYDCAQIVKSFGGSPVMAHAYEEVEEMASIASALVINIGTLTEDFIKSAKKAAVAANSRNIPVVIDVCGAGATAFRDRKSMELLNETRIDIIKGNASEVARIAGFSVKTRGVDSADVNENLEDVARGLASDRSCTVVITGKQDIVAGASGVYTIDNGNDMMGMVVGTGCMAASVIGTFAGANPEDYASAAAAGLSCFGIAGELALAKSDGPGSFKTGLLDCAAKLSQENIDGMQKISE
jgi:hydroxyethylthiazole kinase